MAAKNGHLRPEVVLSIGDRKIKMRPTMQALEAIERRRAIVEIYQSIRDQKPRFSDLALVISEGAQATGEELSYTEAFELVQAHFLLCSVACFNFTACAFGPPPEAAAAGPPPAV